MNASEYYAEPPRQVPVISEVDVLVVGGGPSGVAAAVAAARTGARTFLVEQSGSLGGMWTNGLVLTLAGFNSWLAPERSRVVDGVGGEWLRRAAEIGGALDHDGWALSTDPEKMKLVADAMLEDAGVNFLFHVLGTYPIVENHTVTGCVVETVEGRAAIYAKVTVDATGDGDILSRSGADWAKGETLQPMTMSMFIGNVATAEGVDHTQPVRVRVGPEPGYLDDDGLDDSRAARRDIPVDVTAMQQARARGELPVFGGPWFGGLDKNRVWVNSVRVLGDATDVHELTRAEVQGRRDAFALFEYLRDHVDGFGAGRLEQTSPTIGVRETRRLVGAYTLTGEDIRSGARFDDAVALGAWPIDVHPTDGQAGVHTMFVPRPYGIPYRTLIPASTDGLLAAGRCISVDREALGSTRVGGTCTAIGHAAGTAAALAAAQGIRPRELDADSLRDALRSQSAIIDPDELVRTPALDTRSM